MKNEWGLCFILQWNDENVKNNNIFKNNLLLNEYNVIIIVDGIDENN